MNDLSQFVTVTKKHEKIFPIFKGKYVDFEKSL